MCSTVSGTGRGMDLKFKKFKSKAEKNMFLKNQCFSDEQFWPIKV